MAGGSNLGDGATLVATNQFLRLQSLKEFRARLVAKEMSFDLGLNAFWCLFAITLFFLRCNKYNLSAAPAICKQQMQREEHKRKPQEIERGERDQRFASKESTDKWQAIIGFDA